VSLEALGTHTKVRVLDLSMCQLCTDLGLQKLLDGKKKCGETIESLNLYETKLTNLSLILISKKCQSLKFLGLYGLDHLDSTGLEALLSSTVLSQLEKLDIGGCQKLSPTLLEGYRKKFPHLQRFLS